MRIKEYEKFHSHFSHGSQRLDFNEKEKTILSFDAMTSTTISQKLSALKSLPLHDALPRLGISVSPQGFFKVRSERTASTHILPSGKMWFDHGSQEKGDLISLFQSLTNQSFTEAVSTLYNQFYGTFDGILPTYHPTAQSPSEARKTPIYTAIPLGLPTSKCLTEYCAKRGIPMPIAQDFLTALAVSYTTPRPNTANKPFLTLGWLSEDAQSWHCRNGMEGSRSKCICGKQSISVYRYGSRYLEIYEGMFSYLSSRCLKPLEMLNGDAMILNSVSNVNRALDWIAAHKSDYEAVYLVCDKDKAGRQATGALMDGMARLGIRSVNLNATIPTLVEMPETQDLNDYLLSMPHLSFCRSCRLCKWYQHCNIARGKRTFTARKCEHYSPIK